MTPVLAFTAIDTLYELKGLHMAMRFQEALFWIVVPVLLVIGIVRALHAAQEEHRYRGVIFQIFYSLFMVWLLEPIEVAVSLPPGLTIRSEEDIAKTWDDLNPEEGDEQKDARVTIKAPRVLAWTHLGIDRLALRLVAEVNASFVKEPFGSSRAVVFLHTAHIHDPSLRERYQGFVLSCYLPLVASLRQNGEPEPSRFYNPLSVPYMRYSVFFPYSLKGQPVDQNGSAIEIPDDQRVRDPAYVKTFDELGREIPRGDDGKFLTDEHGNIVDRNGEVLIWNKNQTVTLYEFDQRRTMCNKVAEKLHKDLIAHVTDNPAQAKTRQILNDTIMPLRSKAKWGNAEWTASSKELLLEYILYNETMGLLTVPEIQRLQEVMPSYQMFESSQQSTAPGSGGIDGTDVAIAVGLKVVAPFLPLGEAYLAYKAAPDVISAGVKAGQSVNQYLQHQAEGPALYYRAQSYAPWMYGLASMILLALFPFAGFIAILPRFWTSLLTWAKYLLWIKLWLVFWAILAAFNDYRMMEGLGTDPSNGIGDATGIFPAIAAMYLATPALSLIVVQLLTAGAKGISNAVGNLAPSAGAQSPINVWSMAEKGGNAAAGGL